jgi:hypothetical protein
MEDKLKAYLQSETVKPPRVSENQIIETLSKRRKRLSIIMLSFAGALWTALLYAAAFWLGKEVSPDITTVMLLLLSLGYICAGCFAGIVVKFRKVGF